ncbi:MAG TPA: hypothetical protein VLR90_16495 [Blastocatellia bacterium]|nr:hypothetical protein [Blastocatellia bacterium]
MRELTSGVSDASSGAWDVTALACVEATPRRAGHNLRRTYHKPSRL